MSKFAVIGLIANVATTIGIAAPMGIEINKEKNSDDWNDVIVYDESKLKQKFGTGSMTLGEYLATRRLYNKFCYEYIYKTRINLRKFCLSTAEGLDPNQVS